MLNLKKIINAKNQKNNNWQIENWGCGGSLKINKIIVLAWQNVIDWNQDDPVDNWEVTSLKIEYVSEIDKILSEI